MVPFSRYESPVTMTTIRHRSMYNNRPEDVENTFQYYRSTSDYVKRFVDCAVLNALKIIDSMGNVSYDDRYGITMREMGCFGNKWPTCGSMNTQNGLESVKREMATWNALWPLNEWMFHVDSMGLERKGNTDFYMYEVLWSVPTPAYPEPQVTVSVYFYLATKRTYPPDYPTDVRYVLEGHQFTHSLTMIFRPKWLYDILDMKTMMFQSFDF